MNLRLLHEFKNSTAGNFGMVLAILMVPLAVTAGLAVDYTQGTQTRSDMQNALDAAAFAAMSLPQTATTAERAQALQNAYVANGGRGQAVIDGDVVLNAESAMIKVNATYQMPTNFMGLIGRSAIDLSTTASVSSPLKLSTARFDLDGVTGAWDKTVTLMGRKEGSSTYEPLLRMVYITTNIGGWGDTTLSKKNSAGNWVDTLKLTCTAMRTCSRDVISGDGTSEVDMGAMEDVYLQMDISANVGQVYWFYDEPMVTLKTTDSKTWESMFVEGKQMEKNQPVDVLHAIGCNNRWVEHRWEDGGGHEGVSAWEGTDFRYLVQGKCTIDGTGKVRLTQ